VGDFSAEKRTLDSHDPIGQPQSMEIIASSFKLRSNALESQKAISYQAVLMRKIFGWFVFVFLLSFSSDGIAQASMGNQSVASLQGSGTASDPYLISSKADLLAMAADRENYNKYFKLTADIDLAGEVFTSSVIAPPVNPVGSPDWSYGGGRGLGFNGSFDGDGHVIRNLTINDPVGLWVGLFGQITGYGLNPIGVVKNLGLENCNINGARISGHGLVGGICGDNYGGTIENCYVTGSISGQGYVGGICGDNYGAKVRNSYSLCSISAYWRGGGLCGRNYEGTIENCYAAGAVSGSVDIGGLTGNNNYGGSVSTTLNSFWDTQASGRTTSAGGTGKSTAQMKTQSTFSAAGWDFSSSGIWRMSAADTDSGGYPVLSFGWQAFVKAGGWQAYLARNNDLIHHGIHNEAQAFEHWWNYGRAENRPFADGNFRSDLDDGSPDPFYEIQGGFVWEYPPAADQQYGNTVAFITQDAPKPAGWDGRDLLLQKGDVFNLGPDFEAASYRQMNPDVAQAIDSGAVPSFLSVTDHYVKYGFKEGRLINNDWTQAQLDAWNDAAYLAANRDVNSFFMGAQSEGWKLFGKIGFAHFINFGRAEGRSTGQ
jgi:hypothetical protein